MKREQFEKAKEIMEEIEILENIYNNDERRFYVDTNYYGVYAELPKSLYNDFKKTIKERINSLKTELEQL